MPDPGPATKAVAIVNPTAGGGSRSAALAKAMGQLGAAGWRLEVCETEGAGHAGEIARRAADQGADVAVVVGGDGTVNEVAGALVGSHLALAVLPAGTGNVLAGQLGLIGVPTPLFRADLPAAAKKLARGRVVEVDMGLARTTAGERHFLLWAGAGFDAEAAFATQQRHPHLKQALGTAAFGVVAAWTALAAEPVEAVVSGDDWRLTTTLGLAVAANVPLYAGTVNIAPGAAVDDGLLDVALFPGDRTAWLLQTAGAIVAASVRSDARHVRRTTRVLVETATPLRVHVDAEPHGTTPMQVTTIPRALRLLVPPSAPDWLFVDGPGGAAS